MRRLLVLVLVLAACTPTAPKATPKTTAASPVATAAAASSSVPTSVAPTTTTTIPLTVVPEAAAFSPTVARVYDSRTVAVLEAGERRDIPVSAPAGASAVLVTITMFGTTEAGNLVVWGDGEPPPFGTVYVAGDGDAVGKTVLSTLGAQGTISVLSSTRTHVVADVAGWFTPSPRGASAGRFVRSNDSRVFDGDVSGTSPVRIALDSVPVDATALVSVALTDAAPPGYVEVVPTGAAAGLVSQLQLPALGWTATNLVAVANGQGRSISLSASSPCRATVDLVGWFTGPSAPKDVTGLVVPLSGNQLVEQHLIEPPFRRNSSLKTAGLPVASASAVWVDVHASNVTDAGQVRVYPAQRSRGLSALALPGAGLDTTSSLVSSVGTGDEISVAADQAMEIALTLRAYVIGRPVPPDPLIPRVPATAQGTPVPAGFDATIEQMLFETNALGATVAVAKDGRLVFARAYGARDDAETPMRVDSRLRYASMTKTFTAAALLQLVERGQVALDEPAFELLAGRLRLPAGHDPRLSLITVRHLLSHTSGLRTSPDPFFNEEPGVAEVFGLPGADSCQKAARWFVSLPMTGDPGATFGYRNINYCLLGLLVEVVSGQSLADYLTQHVLSPRGIDQVGIGRSQRFATNDVAHRTPPADVPGGGLFMEALGGAGNLVGSTVDLVRFLDGLDNAKPGPHLLSDDMSRQLVTAQPNTGGWGLGLDLLDTGRWGHTGGLHGARGMMLHQANGVTWALIINGSVANHQSLFDATMRRALATVSQWPTWDYNSELP